MLLPLAVKQDDEALALEKRMIEIGKELLASPRYAWGEVHHSAACWGARFKNERNWGLGCVLARSCWLAPGVCRLYVLPSRGTISWLV